MSGQIFHYILSQYRGPCLVRSPQLSNYFKKAGPFQAVIAFYPWCAANLDDSESALLILIGEKDTWTRPTTCQVKVPLGKTKHEVILKIYPGATHAFDIDQPEGVRYTHRIAYDAKATADATNRTKGFLEKYLKKKSPNIWKTLRIAAISPENSTTEKDLIYANHSCNNLRKFRGYGHGAIATL